MAVYRRNSPLREWPVLEVVGGAAITAALSYLVSSLAFASHIETSIDNLSGRLYAVGHDLRKLSYKLKLTRVPTSELVENLFHECDLTKGDYHGLCKYVWRCYDNAELMSAQSHGPLEECLPPAPHRWLQGGLYGLDVRHDGAWLDDSGRAGADAAPDSCGYLPTQHCDWRLRRACRRPPHVCSVHCLWHPAADQAADRASIVRTRNCGYSPPARRIRRSRASRPGSTRSSGRPRCSAASRA
jgi:hypothetical protein